MVLSFSLVILWNHEISVFAEDLYPDISTRYTVSSGQSVTIPLVSLQVWSDTEYRYSYTSTGSSISTLVAAPYYNNNMVSLNYDLSFRLPTAFHSPAVVTVPEGYNTLDFTLLFKCAPLSVDGYSSGYSITSGRASLPNGSSVDCVIERSGGYIRCQFEGIPVVPGYNFGLSNVFIVLNVVEWASSSTSVTPATYSPSVKISPFSAASRIYRSLDPSLVEALGSQTEDLTTGFDSSSGDQAADQLGQELDNYLQAEDALYDQMQYEVPEVDLLADAQGILLASNFLQSLYVSDAFISKVITYVLSFGLILFIVGWLKKRDSG